MANRGPTINDITAAELEPLLRMAAQLDPLLGEAVASGSLRVVCSGSDLPVIDLTQVGPRVGRGAVRHGMGSSECGRSMHGTLLHGSPAHWRIRIRAVA